MDNSVGMQIVVDDEQDDGVVMSHCHLSIMRNTFFHNADDAANEYFGIH